MRALLIVFCATGLVFAQGGKKNKRPVFDFPKADEADHEDVAATEANAEMQRTLQRLAGWPGAQARKAAQRLIVQKERSLPYIKALLIDNRDSVAPLKAGAAYVMGRIGTKDESLTLLLIATEKKQQPHAATFLEAAWRLDEKTAVAEAFRFFHLSETTLRREAFKFVLARVTADNLPAIHDLIDRRRSEKSFTREIGLRLLDRLVQTNVVEWEDVAPLFYRSLGDESPSVSSRVMRILAGRNDEANVKALNELVTKEMSYWRQRSYAALALGLMSSVYKIQPFEEKTIEILMGPLGLRHPKEMLAQASSALAIAQVALRTNRRDLVELLDREVPIVLIDAVGARQRHYRDFESVMPLAYSMLRRITGQSIPDHAPRWAEWWQDHGRRFRAKRELIEVANKDMAEVEVELTKPRVRGGERIRLSALGKERPTFRHGRALALPREDIKAFVEYLRSVGFFAQRETDLADVQGDAALLVMRVGDLDRKVAYDIGEGATAIRDAIIARIDDLADEYAWQLYWNRSKQPSWQLFFLDQLRWFRENEDAGERATRLREMATGALPSLLEVKDRLHAVRMLAKLPGGGAGLTDKQITAIVKSVASERVANEFVGAAVDLLVPSAGPGAAAALIDSLADKLGPEARAMLVRLCLAVPENALAGLSTDERWKVRRAAVGALAQSKSPSFSTTLLVPRLKDAETAVQIVAAEALARRRNPVVIPTLKKLSGPAQPAEVRGTAAYAYGLLATPSAHKAIKPLLLEDPTSEVKIRAIHGLRDGKDTTAVPLLLSVFENVSDRVVRSAAASAIVSLETPELVDRLIEELQFTDALDPQRVALVNVIARFKSDKPLDILRAVVQGDDMRSADAAAFGLARRWDRAALVQLIRLVKRGGETTRTGVRHLQILTSTGFDVESFKRQAENYEAWAGLNTDGNPRTWFRNALSARGEAVDSLKEWAEAAEAQPIPDEAVPLLLRALRDKDWYIVRNASFILSARMGAGAPEVITYSTSRADEEKAIAAYHDWWSKIVAARRKAEKG